VRLAHLGVLASGVVAGLRGPTVARVFPKDAADGDWFALDSSRETLALLQSIDTEAARQLELAVEAAGSFHPGQNHSYALVFPAIFLWRD
jgi:hypothetical protein